MTISTKALFAALLLTLTPAIASATGVNNIFVGNGPSIGGIVGQGSIASPINGGQPIPNPAQSSSCGAEYAQSLIGVNASFVPFPGNVQVLSETLAAHASRGISYRPDRLTVVTNTGNTIVRVYCG